MVNLLIYGSYMLYRILHISVTLRKYPNNNFEGIFFGTQEPPQFGVFFKADASRNLRLYLCHTFYSKKTVSLIIAFI